MSLNRNSLVRAIGAIISGSLLSASVSATAKQDYNMKIAITVNDNTFTATLNNSQASRDFAALLPLTLQMKDYGGEEKISDLPSRVSTADSPAGTSAKKGDLTIYAPQKSNHRQCAGHRRASCAGSLPSEQGYG